MTTSKIINRSIGSSARAVAERSRQLSKRVASKLQLTLIKESNKLIFGRAHYDLEQYKDASSRKCFVRIGPLFFMENAEHSKLSRDLKRELGSNAVLIDGLNSSFLAFQGFRLYTISTIIAMFNADLACRHVIDAGAGDGMLTLAAKKLGASSFDLIDRDGKNLRRAKTNLELNGLIEGKDFFLHQLDLRKTDAIIRRLKSTDRKVAVISDIGYWPKLYKVDNGNSIGLIHDIKDRMNIELFIAGGYNNLIIEHNAIKLLEKFRIKALGFNADRFQAFWTDGIISTNAWIATKRQTFIDERH